MRSGLRLVDADDAACTRFGAPYLTRTSVELADVGAGLVGREGKEGLALGIETYDGIGGEVGEPDDVGVVDVDGIGAWPLARQLPLLPAAVSRVVHRDVPAVPFADPQPALAVGPHAARALLRRRRLDDAGRPARCVDLGEIVAGQRHVPDRALRRGGDAVGPGTARRIPRLHVLGLGIEAADDAGLPGEPQHALGVEGRGVEVGARLAGHEEELDAPVAWHVAADRVL